MEGYSLFIFEWLKDVAKYIGYDIVLLCAAAVILLPFAVLFIWSFCSHKMRIKKKLPYLYGEICFLALFACVCVLKEKGNIINCLFYPFAAAAITAVLYLALYIQSVVGVKEINYACASPAVSNDDKELYAFAEKCLRECDAYTANKQNGVSGFKTENINDNVEYIRPAPPVVEAVAEAKLNTTHLRELTKMLYSYDLTLQDRKSVRELDEMSTNYDKGIVTSESKIRLSDGINTLMRIMARYN